MKFIFALSLRPPSRNPEKICRRKNIIAFILRLSRKQSVFFGCPADAGHDNEKHLLPI